MLLLTINILCFTAVVVFVSYSISMKYKQMERGEIATYIILIAWSALAFGMYMARFHREIFF